MSDRQKLWQQVEAIKWDVQKAIGSDLSYDFRSTNEYQAYTGLCGEALFAYEDGELDAEVVAKLQEYADKVIAMRQSLAT